MLEPRTIDEAVHIIYVITTSNSADSQQLFPKVIGKLLDRELTYEEEEYAKNEFVRLVLEDGLS